MSPSTENEDDISHRKRTRNQQVALHQNEDKVFKCASWISVQPEEKVVYLTAILLVCLCLHRGLFSIRFYLV